MRNDLLQLDAISGHSRQIVGELRFEDDSASLQVARRQRDDFPCCFVQIQRLDSEFLLAEQCTQTRDHISGAVPVAKHSPRGLPRTLDVWRTRIQHPKAGARIRDDAGKRLIDLVRDRGSQRVERRDSRHVCQLCARVVQRILGAPPIFYVGVDPVPFDDLSSFVAQRIRAEEKPPIFAVGSAQPRFGLASHARVLHLLPRHHQIAQVIGMHGRRPPRAARLFRSESNVVQVMLVEEFGAAVDRRGPHQRGYGVDDQHELALARLYHLFGALHIVNVRQHDVPPGDLIVIVAHGQRSNLEPSINAIGASAPMLNQIRPSRRYRLRECRGHSRQIVRMHGVVRRPRLQVLACLSEVFEDFAAEELDTAAGIHRNNEAGKAFDELAVVHFDRVQHGLCPPPVINVRV